MSVMRLAEMLMSMMRLAKMPSLHNLCVRVSVGSVLQPGAMPSPPRAALRSRPGSCAINLQGFTGIRCAFADQITSLLCNLRASKSPP